LNIDVEVVYGHSVKPYPTHISQSEKQLVKFIGNIFFYSPYKTLTLTTTVNCPSTSIEYYTKEKPVTSADRAITYGPHENVDPFKQVRWHNFLD
jgi:oligosaccharyltransferase complex subunit alpha (ribophorin I)